MDKQDREDFVKWLYQLKATDGVVSESRSALAELRRRVLREPSAKFLMHVNQYIPHSSSEREVIACHLVASLFAHHPSSLGGSMGTSFKAASRGDSKDAMDKRFCRLLECDFEDIEEHLFSAITLMKSKGVGVNWFQLLDDLISWEDQPSGLNSVALEWARDCW